MKIKNAGRDPAPKAPKVRDLTAKKDAKGGGGGIHVGPSGPGG